MRRRKRVGDKTTAHRVCKLRSAIGPGDLNFALGRFFVRLELSKFGPGGDSGLGKPFDLAIGGRLGQKVVYGQWIGKRITYEQPQAVGIDRFVGSRLLQLVPPGGGLEPGANEIDRRDLTCVEL